MNNRLCPVAVFVLLAGLQLLAHHGADETAIYKGAKPVNLTGSIVKDTSKFVPDGKTIQFVRPR